MRDTDSETRTLYSGLSDAGYGQRTADYLMRDTDSETRTLYSGLSDAEYGQRTADYLMRDTDNDMDYYQWTI